jgi:hypothetical protein
MGFRLTRSVQTWYRYEKHVSKGLTRIRFLGSGKGDVLSAREISVDTKARRQCVYTTLEVRSSQQDPGSQSADHRHPVPQKGAAFVFSPFDIPPRIRAAGETIEEQWIRYNREVRSCCRSPPQFEVLATQKLFVIRVVSKPLCTPGDGRMDEWHRAQRMFQAALDASSVEPANDFVTGFHYIGSGADAINRLMRVKKTNLPGQTLWMHNVIRIHACEQHPPRNCREFIETVRESPVHTVAENANAAVLHPPYYLD